MDYCSILMQDQSWTRLTRTMDLKAIAYSVNIGIVCHFRCSYLVEDILAFGVLQDWSS